MKTKNLKQTSFTTIRISADNNKDLADIAKELTKIFPFKSHIASNDVISYLVAEYRKQQTKKE